MALENQQQNPPQGKDVHHPRFILIAEVQGACGIYIVEAERLPIFDSLRCLCLRDRPRDGEALG